MLCHPKCAHISSANQHLTCRVYSSTAVTHATDFAQVVHHPTVIAAHGEGAHWSFAGDAEVRSKFWGRSIELIPVGLIRLTFDDGDEYNWAKVSDTQEQALLGFPLGHFMTVAAMLDAQWICG